MLRAPSRHERDVIGVRARFVVVGVLGALLLVGALHGSGADPSAPAAGQSGDHSSYVVQHEATVSANAANPSRSHRLVALGAFLVVAAFAAIAAGQMESRQGRRARRRVEQFHVRLRGPPHLLVAH